MAYQFPVGYQQMYYPQYNGYNPSQIQNNQQNQGSGIIWVQGEAGAKSYLVAPNTTVQLWDSESQVIYLKSADASGMPSMRIIDYTIRDNTSQNAPISSKNDFATKDDILYIQKQIDEIKATRASGKERQHESSVQRNNTKQ